jgi:hypothetical protein
MWQRFTEKARRVVFYAQEEAQRYGVGYVSTEHLLLGLLRERDNVAVHVLSRLSIFPERVESALAQEMVQTGERAATDMTLTSSAKHVIDLAFAESRALDNDYIGTEHLLLGLLAEGDGLAGRVLSKLGANLDGIRVVVRAIQQSGKDEGSTLAPSGSPQVARLAATVVYIAANCKRSELRQFLENLNLFPRDWVEAVEFSAENEEMTREIFHQASQTGVTLVFLIGDQEEAGEPAVSKLVFAAQISKEIAPERTIVLRVGSTPLGEDLDQTAIRLDNSRESRLELIGALRLAGCFGDGWLTAGDFGSAP